MVRIGKLKDGVLTTVYLTVVSDLKYIGKTLKENYKNEELDYLLEHGDLVSIGDSLEKCVFYHRDRKEDYTECLPFSEHVSSIEEIDVLRSPVNYYFINHNKKWFVWDHKLGWSTIAKFLNRLK